MEPEGLSDDSFTDRLVSFLTTPANRQLGLALTRRPGVSIQNTTCTDGGVLWRQSCKALESYPGVIPFNTSQNRPRERQRDYHRPTLDRSAVVQSIATALDRLQSYTTKRTTAVHLRVRQSRLGIGTGGSGIVAQHAVRDAIAVRLPSTPGGRASLRLADSILRRSTAITKTSQWNKFNRFCEVEGHCYLPASRDVIMAYIGYLFKEDRVHSSSLEHYISAIRIHHIRFDLPDLCTGEHQSDLRMSKREDDALGTLQDIRADLSAHAVSRIHAQPPNSRTHWDAAIIEFQYLMSKREASAKNVRTQDVPMSSFEDESGIHYRRITTRPRTLKGRAIRSAPPSKITCRQDRERDALALQAQFFDSSRDRAPPALYSSIVDDTPGSQHVTKALQDILACLGWCRHPSPTIRHEASLSGSLTALVLLGVQIPVIVCLGIWEWDRLVMNVYYDGCLKFTISMEYYFWSLLPRTKLPPPQ